MSLTEYSFSVKQLEEILKDTRVKPVVNQIQFHPGVLAESEALLAFHEKHYIATEGYSPNRPLRDGSAPGLVKVVERIAEERGIQPDQVLLAWSRSKGYVNGPRSPIFGLRRRVLTILIMQCRTHHHFED